MGFAYWSDAVRDAMAAKDSPTFARLACAGPWQFTDWRHEGVRGVLAQWKGAEAGVEQYGAPRKCADGLLYFPSKRPLTQPELAKRGVPKGIDVLTSRGVTLTIPLAVAAPRMLAFDGPDVVGDLASEYGALAAKVFDDMVAKRPIADADIVRLIALAIGESYRVTPEALSDLRWITTSDIDPILSAMMGADPFPSADAGGSSPSPASAT